MVTNVSNYSSENKKIFEYEWIRLFAIITVVIGHSCYMGIGYTHYSIVDPSPAINWDIFRFQRWLAGFVYSFHMPLFFILSGVVFGTSFNRNRIENFQSFAKKKFERLIIPYVLYGLFYMIPIKFLMNWYHPNLSFFDINLKYLLFGSASGHLWFLSSLFYAFLIAWIMISFAKSSSLAGKFMLFVFSYLICVWGGGHRC